MLRNLGSNRVEIEYSDGTIVFYAYNTAVAACMGDGSGFVRTDKKWSRTTSKHINQWLEGRNARLISQDELNAIANMDEKRRVAKARVRASARSMGRTTRCRACRALTSPGARLSSRRVRRARRPGKGS